MEPLINPFATNGAPARSDGVSATLPGEYYHSEAIFQQELEKIFFPSWICAGRETDLARAGDFFTRQAGEESIIVTRDKGGRVCAFFNVCRHRGARLCSESAGRFRGEVISCPYHRWTFGLDGQLLATPNLQECDLDRGEYPLYPIGVETREGFIYINLRNSAEPLHDPLGGFEEQAAAYLMGTLSTGRTLTYDVAANWKIVVENFMECYHCPGVHPELCQLVPDFRRAIVHQGRPDGAQLIEGATTLTTSGTSNRKPIEGLSQQDIGVYRSRVRYPNLFLSFHCDYVLTHTLWPLGPRRTVVICDWLFEPETMAQADFDPSDGVEIWDLVNRQDWEMCELTQQGVVSSAYHHGVYGPKESLLQEFNQRVARDLAG